MHNLLVFTFLVCIHYLLSKDFNVKLLSKILTIFVAIEHLFILWIEVFAWETVGSSVFTVFPEEFFSMTKSMAANQGVYNGFLAAGLIWATVIKDKVWSFNITLFFLACVIFASIFGCLTIETKILFTQGVPAFIALILVLIARK